MLKTTHCFQSVEHAKLINQNFTKTLNISSQSYYVAVGVRSCRLGRFQELQSFQYQVLLYDLS